MFMGLRVLFTIIAIFSTTLSIIGYIKRIDQITLKPWRITALICTIISTILWMIHFYQ